MSTAARVRTELAAVLVVTVALTGCTSDKVDPAPGPSTTAPSATAPPGPPVILRGVPTTSQACPPAAAQSLPGRTIDANELVSYSYCYVRRLRRDLPGRPLIPVPESLVDRLKDALAETAPPMPDDVACAMIAIWGPAPPVIIAEDMAGVRWQLEVPAGWCGGILEKMRALVPQLDGPGSGSG